MNVKNNLSNLLPILKWPGGKRWLSKTLVPIIRDELQGCYFEPFLGGGATFLALCPKEAVLSDANEQLINFYKCCVKNPKETVRAAMRRGNTKTEYYEARQSKPTTETGRAGRFLYLNKTCWGGVYRLNKKGEFNVPFGNSGRAICDKQSIYDAALVFGKAQLMCSDFGLAFDKCKKGDVVFADPPYTSLGQFNGFVRYNEKLFSWADQVRLSILAKKAKRKGTFVAVCGSFHRDVVALYRNWWILEVKRKTTVARKAKKSNSVSECVVFSRKPKHCEYALQRITNSFLESIPHNE